MKSSKAEEPEVFQKSDLIFKNVGEENIANEGEITFDLYKPGEKTPRYTFHVVEDHESKSKSCKTFAAFIVPQGWEVDWTFNKKEGRQNLLKTTKYDKLVIIILRREHKFESLEIVKEEIAKSIRSLAPDGHSLKEIPILSVHEGVGTRNICYEGVSEISGPFVVEEIEKAEHSHLRLVFMHSQFFVQSQVRFKLVKSEKGEMQKVVDVDFLSGDHNVHLSVAAGVIAKSKKDAKVLLLGLGGGTLCLFLRHCFPQLKITAVDIDKEMLKVSTNYFGLVLNENIEVEIGDGLKFLENAAKEGSKFDAIVYDMDNKDMSLGMLCPPQIFIEVSVLNLVATCLEIDGLFTSNTMIKNDVLKQAAMKNIEKVFKFISKSTITADQDVVVASMNAKRVTEWKEMTEKHDVAALTELLKAGI